MPTGWQYILMRTSDRSPIGEMLNARDRTLSVDLNKSGSAGGNVATAWPHAKQIVPWATYVQAQIDGEPYWSGPVSRRNVSYARGVATFNCVGWFDRLMNFLLQDQQLSFVDEDAGTIAATLIEKARVQDPRLPITVGQIDISQPRTITYMRDQNIGSAIADLVELESGFDWYIDPVDITFNVVARRGVARPGVKWLFLADDKSQQSNLTEVDEGLDGTTVVNWVAPRGAVGTIEPAIDAESQEDYGVFMEAPALSDVTSPNILIAYAVAEIVYRKSPRLTWALSPKTDSKASVPRLGRDFDLGDTTYLTARRDDFEVVNQAVRAFGATLSIQNDGSSILTNLQTSAG